MPERFSVHLDLFDLLALAGALLIALGLLLWFPPLCLLWLGALLLVPSVMGARKWASRSKKETKSSSSPEES